jgi:hypothetical protein
MTEKTQKENTNSKANEEVSGEEVRTEEYVFSGDEVVAKIKELFHEGNIRRLTVYSESGTVLLDVPLTIGLVGMTAGFILAPVLSAIAVLAGVLTRLKVTVEHVETAE